MGTGRLRPGDGTAVLESAGIRGDDVGVDAVSASTG